MDIPKYISRIKESGGTYSPSQQFLYWIIWMDMEDYYELVAELLTLSPNKHQYYQQGQRAMRLILSAS